MRTLLIGYDLKSPGRDYTGLYDAIKSHSTAWWHHLDSTWLIKTAQTPADVRNGLLEHLDRNDELLVIDVTTRSRAWHGFNDRGSKWLRETYQ
jgi:hypothetical protein